MALEQGSLGEEAAQNILPMAWSHLAAAQAAHAAAGRGPNASASTHLLLLLPR